MEGKNCLIVVPHFDDEVFIALPFLTQKWSKLLVLFTAPYDFLDDEEAKAQTAMANKYLGKLGVGYEIIKDGRTLAGIECTLKEWGHIDYFVTTEHTKHPSHASCYTDCSQILRHPWRDKINQFIVRPPLIDMEPSFTWDTLIESDSLAGTAGLLAYVNKIDIGYRDMWEEEITRFNTTRIRYRTVWRIEAV